MGVHLKAQRSGTRRQASGFVSLELSLVAILIVAALTFAAQEYGQRSKSKAAVRATSAADLVLRQLSDLARDPLTLRQSALARDSKSLEACLTGSGGGCKHGNSYDFEFRSQTGQPLAGSKNRPVYYNTFGELCGTDRNLKASCPIAAYARFSPTCTQPCDVAYSVTVDFSIEQEKDTLSFLGVDQKLVTRDSAQRGLSVVELSQQILNLEVYGFDCTVGRRKLGAGPVEQTLDVVPPGNPGAVASSDYEDWDNNEQRWLPFSEVHCTEGYTRVSCRILTDSRLEARNYPLDANYDRDVRAFGANGCETDDEEVKQRSILLITCCRLLAPPR